MAGIIGHGGRKLATTVHDILGRRQKVKVESKKKSSTGAVTKIIKSPYWENQSLTEAVTKIIKSNKEITEYYELFNGELDFHLFRKLFIETYPIDTITKDHAFSCKFTMKVEYPIKNDQSSIPSPTNFIAHSW